VVRWLHPGPHRRRRGNGLHGAKAGRIRPVRGRRMGFSTSRPSLPLEAASRKHSLLAEEVVTTRHPRMRVVAQSTSRVEPRGHILSDRTPRATTGRRALPRQIYLHGPVGIL
jgi:hypothetical protein